MASYQVLCWQEIPAQVRAEDETGEVQIELPVRFQVMIDRVATERGQIGTDEYLEGWAWSEEKQREGTAQQVAAAVAKELEEQYPEKCARALGSVFRTPDS
jgi:hypothetical protein